MISIILIIILSFIVWQLKDWFRNYIRRLKTYETIICPSNRLPLLGNILQLPLNPYRKISISEREIVRFLSVEFSKKVDVFYEQGKDFDLCCFWLGTYPLLVFFHSDGLKVCHFEIKAII